MSLQIVFQTAYKPIFSFRAQLFTFICMPKIESALDKSALAQGLLYARGRVSSVSESSEVVHIRVEGLAILNFVIKHRDSLERGNSSLLEEQSTFQQRLCHGSR
jgi:hypothetical protein